MTVAGVKGFWLWPPQGCVACHRRQKKVRFCSMQPKHTDKGYQVKVPMDGTLPEWCPLVEFVEYSMDMDKVKVQSWMKGVHCV